MCDWCSRELSGHGRRSYDDLDLALEAFRAPLENRRLIKAELRNVEHDAIWIPCSGSYVALGVEGRGVAWTGKTYVVPRAGGSTPLRGCTDSSRGGHARLAQRPGVMCSSCWQVKAVTGVCGCE